MSTTDPRFIIVDNVDSSIDYTGPWFLNQGGQNNVGNFGPPYQSTLHGANADASFSFAFNGSQIRVVGSNNIRNDSGVLDPTWRCFVDGTSINVPAPFAFPENNWLFCNQDNLADGSHVLTVNATILKNQTFWFDNIQYVPSASVPLDQAAIVIDHLDPQIRYGSGWGALGDTANMTTVAGSTFSFDFIGVSLSWYGFIPNELPIGPSSGTYSIDGKTPISFTLQGLPSNTTATTYNQKFFETGHLSATSHSLQVVYQGSSTPLTLTNLIIQNGTASMSTSSLTTAPTTGVVGSPASSTSPEKSPILIGSIVGGVIGGLALVLFAVLGFYFLRRRQKRFVVEIETASIVSTTPNPFEYTPLHQSANDSSTGFSYSQVPQSASPVTFGKGLIYNRPRPSISNDSGSQSVEPQSSSSGAILTQPSSLTLANPSPSSPPTSASSTSGRSPPLPLSSKVEREAEVATTLTPQRRAIPSVPVSVQSNDTWLPNTPGVVLHADSGIRMAAPARTVVDIPPEYTPD